MIWILLFLFTSLVNCDETNQNDGKLIFTQIIFRHGHRTINHIYPNDPYKDESNWPEGYGQLTKIGKQQAFDLGKFLRRRYDTFIGAYHPNKVSILSSEYDCTINSANLVLASLFPPDSDQIWNSNLLWQPIAVHIIPREMDYLLPSTNCVRYGVVRGEHENSPEMRAIFDRHRDLFEYLEMHLGKPIRYLEDLLNVYNTLSIEFQMNKTLETWTSKIFFPGFDPELLSAYYPIISTETTELKKLGSGYLLKEILDRSMNKTLSMIPNQLMQIYSSGVFTISSMMKSLGVFYPHIPKHLSSLLFELYETKDDHYIQLFYKNSTSDDLSPLNIPGCGKKCPLNQWYELYGDILLSDYETECRISSESGSDSFLTANFPYISIIFSAHLVYSATQSILSD